MRSSVSRRPDAGGGRGTGMRAPTAHSSFQSLRVRAAVPGRTAGRDASTCSPSATTQPLVTSTASTGRRQWPRPLGDHSTRTTWPSAAPSPVTGPRPTPSRRSSSPGGGGGSGAPAAAHRRALMAGSGCMRPAACSAVENCGCTAASASRGNSGRKTWMASSSATASSASHDQASACGASGLKRNSSLSRGRTWRLSVAGREGRARGQERAADLGAVHGAAEVRGAGARGVEPPLSAGRSSAWRDDKVGSC